jgi:hypothetical protein
MRQMRECTSSPEPLAASATCPPTHPSIHPSARSAVAGIVPLPKLSSEVEKMGSYCRGHANCFGSLDVSAA